MTVRQYVINVNGPTKCIITLNKIDPNKVIYICFVIFISTVCSLGAVMHDYIHIKISKNNIPIFYDNFVRTSWGKAGPSSAQAWLI